MNLSKHEVLQRFVVALEGLNRRAPNRPDVLTALAHVKEILYENTPDELDKMPTIGGTIEQYHQFIRSMEGILPDTEQRAPTHDTVESLISYMVENCDGGTWHPADDNNHSPALVQFSQWDTERLCSVTLQVAAKAGMLSRNILEEVRRRREREGKELRSVEDWWYRDLEKHPFEAIPAVACEAYAAGIEAAGAFYGKQQPSADAFEDDGMVSAGKSRGMTPAEVAARYGTPVYAVNSDDGLWGLVSKRPYKGAVPFGYILTSPMR